MTYLCPICNCLNGGDGTQTTCEDDRPLCFHIGHARLICEVHADAGYSDLPMV